MGFGRHSRPSQSEHLVRFNRTVADMVRTLDQGAADELMARGSTLGWWDNIRFWFTNGQSASFAAGRIVANYREGVDVRLHPGAGD